MESLYLENDQVLSVACREAVLALFPDICPEYLENTATEYKWDHETLITYILDQAEKGFIYPKRQRNLKRKRMEESTDDEDLTVKFDKPKLRQQASHPGYLSTYIRTSKALLKRSFPQAYAQDVDLVVKENDNALYPSYLVLDKAFAPGSENARFRTKRSPVKVLQIMDDDYLSQQGLGAKHALDEFNVVKRHCEAEAAKRNIKKQQEEFESLNVEQARADGTIAECQCCYDDFPFNRMVHCDADQDVHFFCYLCTRRMAETEIGLSKYKLKCMSMDGCPSGFCLEQRKLFLDDKLLVALERIEMEANLRMAGIENLETCPFCPYAAEYPTVEENKEFRCENQECEAVSCRLCRHETHIPKTCEEAARESGHSARHAIEEAMSAAMIRKCNKCGTPFIKSYGCNKMMCTRNGCKNIQCYVCSKSCDYTHFDDPNRGGQRGKCPLFDSVEQRHQDEVRVAEEAARKLVEEENPDIDASIFEIKVSDKVKEDEERRKIAHPNNIHPARAGPVGPFHAAPGAAHYAIPLPRQLQFLPPAGPLNYFGPPDNPAPPPPVNTPALPPLPQELLPIWHDPEFNNYVAPQVPWAPAPRLDNYLPPAPWVDGNGGAQMFGFGVHQVGAAVGEDLGVFGGQDRGIQENAPRVPRGEHQFYAEIAAQAVRMQQLDQRLELRGTGGLLHADFDPGAHRRSAHLNELPGQRRNREVIDLAAEGGGLPRIHGRGLPPFQGGVGHTA